MLYRLVWFMVFNASFNNISVMSWWSDLSKLVEEIAENHRPVACRRQYYIMFYRVHFAMNRILTHNVSGDRHS